MIKLKTLVLRKLYDYISFLRHELPNLCRVINLSVDDYSNLDSSLKSLISSIDDEILEREVNKYFEIDVKPE